MTISNVVEIVEWIADERIVEKLQKDGFSVQ